MATSGAMSTTNDKIKYTITITQNSRNVSANTSNVTVSVRVYRTNTGYTTYGSGTVYCTINGTQYTEAITSSDKITNSGIVLFTKTLNISHNADGTKTLATSARITHDQFSSSSQSYSQTLTAIPRATTPTVSASSVNMGASITISMPRASSSFTHTLTYKFVNASGTIGSSLETSKAWTVPLSLASQIPSGTSGSCTITCSTYNGSTLIGTKTVSFTAKVPSSVVPTISSVAVADTNSAYATQFGSLVQGKSKAKFTITASGAYSSTITAYKTVIEGKTYTGATPTTSVLTGSGNVTATITVTDSRGRTASMEKTFYRIPYTVPTITVFEAVRADSTGAENYEGTYAKVSAAFSIASASSKNTSSYKIEYKKQSETTWTALQNGTGYTYNNSILSGGVFDVNFAYDIKLTVTDYFGSVTRIANLPTAFTLLDFNASGKGVAFGKVSEQSEGVEFALPIKSTLGHLITSPIALQTGQDLDALKEPAYYVFASNVSTTLLNNPLNGSASGSVEVVKEGEAGQVRQVLTRCSVGYREIWDRLYYSNKWQEWIPVFKGSSGTGRILWSGGMYMTATHKVELSEPILSQPNGIVLVFSRYANGEVQDTNFHHFFIPKAFVIQKNGYGHTFIMAANRFELISTKYLYINNTHITGHADNNITGTANGITFNNASFVMRYVIGV